MRLAFDKKTMKKFDLCNETVRFADFVIL